MPKIVDMRAVNLAIRLATRKGRHESEESIRAKQKRTDDRLRILRSVFGGDLDAAKAALQAGDDALERKALERGLVGASTALWLAQQLRESAIENASLDGTDDGTEAGRKRQNLIETTAFLADYDPLED